MKTYYLLTMEAIFLQLKPQPTTNSHNTPPLFLILKISLNVLHTLCSMV